jgi:hypothetical protein
MNVPVHTPGLIGHLVVATYCAHCSAAPQGAMMSIGAPFHALLCEKCVPYFHYEKWPHTLPLSAYRAPYEERLNLPNPGCVLICPPRAAAPVPSAYPLSLAHPAGPPPNRA